MESPRSSIITLLTDFGLAGPFVGSVKGVILGINPHATIVDLTHDITPFSIAEAAFVLHAAYSSFPKGTIHVAIVDPDVGSARRLVLVSADGSYFLAPDNGLLSYVYRDHPESEIRTLTVTHYHRDAPGNTFHGRDILAPVAGRLTQNVPADAFGPCIDDPVMIPLPQSTPQERAPRTYAGEVIYVDQFGNLITNITAHDVEAIGLREQLHITIGESSCRGIARCYAEGSATDLMALINSSGYLEIFLYRDSAAHRFTLSVGAKAMLMNRQSMED